MNRSMKKLIISAIAIVIIAVFSSVTLAYLLAETEPVINSLNAAVVACEVQESSFDGNVKKEVSIQNTGEVDSYIRAMVVATWMSEDGTKVAAQSPQAETDYTMIYATGTAWQRGADGFWYYTLPVAVGERTGILIESCEINEGATIPEGFYLSVEVIASAIQSTPATAVLEKWDSGVGNVDNGTLVIK